MSVRKGNAKVSLAKSAKGMSILAMFYFFIGIVVGAIAVLAVGDAMTNARAAQAALGLALTCIFFLVMAAAAASSADMYEVAGQILDASD